VIYNELPNSHKDIDSDMQKKIIEKDYKIFRKRIMDKYSKFFMKTIVAIYASDKNNLSYLFYRDTARSILRGANYQFNKKRKYIYDVVFCSIALMKMDRKKIFPLHIYYGEVDENGKFLNFNP